MYRFFIATKKIILKKQHYLIWALVNISILFNACVSTTNRTSSTSKTKTNTKVMVSHQVPSLPDTVRLTPDPYSALVEIETNFGLLKIELFFDAGEHRANFLKLAKNNFYDSLLFHRVIRNFMAQGGDPNSKNAKKGARLGSGGIGYQIPAEIGQHYYHIKGALAAARQPDQVNPEKKSSGSQFYIVQGTTVSPSQLDKNEREHDIVYTNEQRKLYAQLGGSPQLDMEYTVFGRVYEGLEVIDLICNQTTDNAARPKEDIWFKVRIIRE